MLCLPFLSHFFSPYRGASSRFDATRAGFLLAPAAYRSDIRTAAMYTRKSAGELAARVRSLLGPTDRFTLRAKADDLGISEGDLREIVEYQTPYPSAVVLAALVATYGVDAGWLLTGQYSPAAHRADEEVDEPAKSRVARVLDDVQSRIASE